MKILFTGGGTSGHIMPIVAIGKELKALKPDVVLYYIGPKEKESLVLLKSEGFKTRAIVSGKIRRYFSLKNISDAVFNIPFGFLQSFFLLLFIRPRLVFSKGGSGSWVVCLSAKILRIPVFLHESDVVPGLSNQKVSKFAKKIFVSFENTEYFYASKQIVTGNPIRKELLNGSADEAKKIFNLDFQKPTVLFIGGSQGSEAINNFVILILNDLLKNYEIIHVSGAKNYRKMQIESKLVLAPELDKYYHLYPSLSEAELKNAYAVSDFIVARAGSGTIFEIAAVGKPSILIPLPSAAGNHQSKNAYRYADTGAAMVVEEQSLTPNFFLAKINQIISNSNILKRMRESAFKFARPEAGERIAKEIINYLIGSN